MKKKNDGSLGKIPFDPEKYRNIVPVIAVCGYYWWQKPFMWLNIKIQDGRKAQITWHKKGGIKTGTTVHKELHIIQETEDNRKYTTIVPDQLYEQVRKSNLVKK